MTTTRDPRASQPASVTARVRIFIAREQEVVFDYFADLRNEPQYNRAGLWNPQDFARADRAKHHLRGIACWPRASHLATIGVRTADARLIEGGVGQGAYRWTSDF